MAIPSYLEILETLAALHHWEERYEYIIALGKELPPMPETLKTEALLVPGCTSRVWMLAQFEQTKLNLLFDSDALIVKGLLAILYSIFNGLEKNSLNQINLEKEFEAMQLENNLSPNRRNGFFAVAKRIKDLGQLQ